MCYKISDINTLFSAINYWVPELKSYAPAIPLVLLASQTCKGDPSPFKAGQIPSVIRTRKVIFPTN